MSKYAHVLWSPQTGPICAYQDPSLAFAHAATMLGVEVTSVELRMELPEIVLQETEYDGGDTTPVSIDDIEDAEPH